MPHDHSTATCAAGTLADEHVPARRTLVALPSLRAMRIRRALLQRQLAEAAGVSLPTVQRLEGGGAAGLDTVSRLAQALGVEPADLMRELPEA